MGIEKRLIEDANLTRGMHTKFIGDLIYELMEKPEV